MAPAPFISTFVALALIPVAFLFTHAYLSGKRKLPFHKITGLTGIVWDLSMSIFYMLYRTFGGSVESSILDINPQMWVYFAAHGMIAVVVILLELAILGTGVLQWRLSKKYAWHGKLSNPLYLFWFAAFISGEVVYLVYYVL
jgi:hypothetical protein